MRILAVLPVIASLAASTLQTHAAAQVTRLYPAAVKPGATVEITLAGDRLSPLSNLWTSFPCDFECVKAADKEAAFRLSLSSNVPVQIGALRLVGSNVLSDLQLCMVDDLPSLTKTNATQDAPHHLVQGTAVEGACAELQTDYFTFPAKAREAFSIEVVARRLNSALDPLLRILDQKGNELVYSLQYNEPNGDPKIRFTAPVAGTYLIELRDVSYRGGSKFFYRLRFGKFPLVTAPFPPATSSAAKTPIKLLGPAVDRAVTAPMRSGSDGLQPTQPINARFRAAAGSGFSQMLVMPLPQVIEKEPNDTPEQATKVGLPAGINGRFQKAADRDYYEFNLRKGDRLSCVARTRSLGVACDVALQLLDTNNNSVAESKNAGADEGLLSTKVEKDGPYRLLVRELTGAGALDFVYQVAVENRPPGFALAIADDHPQIGTNGLLQLNVSCARDGYDGPIQLRIQGSDDFKVENSTIASKKTNIVLTIRPISEEQKKVSVFQVFGENKDKSAGTLATTIPALRKTFPNLLYCPEQLNSLIWIAPFAAPREKSK